jgi:hypothetical protein
MTFFQKHGFTTIYAGTAATAMILVHLVYHCGWH